MRGKKGAMSFSGVEGHFVAYIDRGSYKNLLKTSWVGDTGYECVPSIDRYLEAWFEEIPCREFTNLFIHDKKSITGELLVSL